MLIRLVILRIKIRNQTAIRNENIGIIELLLSNDKIDINIESKLKVYFQDPEDRALWEYDETPLYFSTQKENIEIVKFHN